MGMFDLIRCELKCPHCNSNNEVVEQMKWLDHDDRSLSYYTLGSEIPVKDDIYDWATWVRPDLEWDCKECGKHFFYAVEVKDRKMKKIYVAKDRASLQEVIDEQTKNKG